MKKTIFQFSFCIFGVFIFTTAVFAESISGSFESYDNGDLNNQDGWSDIWNSPQVQEGLVFDGIKALQNQDAFETSAYEELPEGFFEQGIVSSKIRIENNDFADNQQVFGIFEGIGEDYIALFRFANRFDGYDNMILFSKAGSADVIPVGVIKQGEWHKLSIGWRRSDFKIRVKIDNGEWTPWFDSQTTWHEDEYFGVRITLPPGDNYGDFYLDDLKYFIGDEEPYYDPLLLIEETEVQVLSEETGSDESKEGGGFLEKVKDFFFGGSDEENSTSGQEKTPENTVNVVTEDNNQNVVDNTEEQNIPVVLPPTDDLSKSTTTPEVQNETNSISGELNEEGIITLPF